ncbi:hypothetical protein [uncultured Psychrobacter sp.]|uniref:hypothetical protein n=1 Tax=uncultured Psychrobacter sp. TaxID=259303 RepID=UPI00345B4255
MKHSLIGIILLAALSISIIEVQAAAVVNADETLSEQTSEPNTASTVDTATTNNQTLAAQLQPSESALSNANQKLLSQNAQLQRQVNDLQTQVNVLVFESRGQLFLYGAFTVIISLLVGIFISWLVFVRRDRW